MGALEQFKQKMAENRRSKLVVPSMSERSKKTAIDVGCLINTITHTATRTDLPDEFTIYCRQRYLAVVNSLNFTVDDNFINFNRPSETQLAENPISIADCQNDFLTIIYEPTDKSIFVDNDKKANNLRIEKLVGLFQFHSQSCKLRFFRKTDELDCMSNDESENADAKVLSTSWAVEPYYVKLPPNFLELYLAGEDYNPELNCIIEDATPPDSELIAFLDKFMDILKCVLYSIKTNLNRFCRQTEHLQLRNLRGMNKRIPVFILQLMATELEGLNDQGRAVHKQKPVKAPTPRKPRVKPQKQKRKK